MKTFSILLLTTAGLCSLATASVPKKEPLVKYTGLWTNSPFTSKPPPVVNGPTINPLDDFMLTGIAPIPGGYRITIMSKKNPEMVKVIESGKQGEFSIVSVNRNPGKYLGTTVVLSSGSVQGTVSFEQELLTLKAPPAPQQQKQQLPPGIVQGQINSQANGNDGQRQPRPRIVPPPTTPNANSSKGNTGDSNNGQRSIQLQPSNRSDRGDRSGRSNRGGR